MLSRHKPRREFVDTKNLRHLARTPRTLVRSSLVARPVRGNSHQQHPCSALRTRRSRNRRRNHGSGSHLRHSNTKVSHELYSRLAIHRERFGREHRRGASSTKEITENRREQFCLCCHFKPSDTTLAWDSFDNGGRDGIPAKIGHGCAKNRHPITPT